MSRNIALVGCGAIARQFHLAALTNRRADFGKLWVVDPSEPSRQAARSLVDAEPASALSEIGDELAFVIVASPNTNHFSTAREALSRGAHVLIEKPFVIWPDEGRELIDLAARRDRIIAVNQTRRAFPYAKELRKRITDGEFGALKRIVHCEGVKLDWPFASGAGFAPSAQRTGVIMDFGVHVLDFYHYLLDPNWTYESAIHDGFNGPEGLAEIHLKANDVSVSIRLSRYQQQSNMAHLEFERARISVHIFENSSYFLSTRQSPRASRVSVRAPNGKSESLADRILSNFLSAADGREKAICEAASSLPVIDILDEIYRSAGRYPEGLGEV
jgi:predicted dehydrogenase